MYKVFLTLVLFFSINVSAYYDDHPSVNRLVESGQYSLQVDLSQCEAQLLVFPGVWKKDGLCVEVKSVSPLGLRELAKMEYEQLDNISDYDSRITKVLSFSHDGYLDPERGVDHGLFEELQSAFDIPTDAMLNFNIQQLGADDGSFSQLNEYMYIGEVENLLSETHLGAFIKKEVHGKRIHLTFTSELELYPGGGLIVHYHIVLMDGRTVYLKEVVWNS